MDPKGVSAKTEAVAQGLFNLPRGEGIIQDYVRLLSLRLLLL